MVSKKAKESVEQAMHKLIEEAPKALQAYHQMLVQFIEDYHTAIETDDQAKAGKVRRKLEREARRIRRYEPAEVTAGAIRDLLNGREAPEEWHDLAGQVFPGYDAVEQGNKMSEEQIKAAEILERRQAEANEDLDQSEDQ